MTLGSIANDLQVIYFRNYLEITYKLVRNIIYPLTQDTVESEGKS